MGNIVEKLLGGQPLNDNDRQRIILVIKKTGGAIDDEALTYGAETGGADSALTAQIKQIFDAVVQRYGMKVARDKLTTPNLLKALKLPASSEKDVRIALAEAKKAYGGKVKVVVPDNEVKMGYENWKEQSLTKKRDVSDLIKEIKKLGYSKAIEDKLIKSLDGVDINRENIMDIIKQWDIKRKTEDRKPYHRRYKPKKRVYRKGRGGKAGENFREDYKRYLESLELGDIDPDDKVKIREKKEEIEEEVDNVEEEVDEAVEEGKMTWNEFKKANPAKEHKEDFAEFKKTHQNVTNYYTYLAFLYRKYTGKLIKGDEGYTGEGMYKHRDTSIVNDPVKGKSPVNIDGRPIPWTKKGGSKKADPRTTKYEEEAWKEHHTKLPESLKKGNLSNVIENVGGKAKKGKIPEQLKAWHSFLKAHPWDGKEDRREYLKKMGKLYKK